MVGALSIVRFRTAIKDSVDLMFLFWAIAVGIICGVGLGKIAVLLSLFLTILITILDRLPSFKTPLLLIIESSEIGAEDEIMEIVKNMLFITP